MSIMVLMAKNLYRKNDFYTSFMFSLDIILLMNCYNIENIGMWLSFSGTIGLVEIKLFSSKELVELYRTKENNSFFMRNIKDVLIDSFNSSLAVYIVIFPIILYSYNTFSFTFFISNFLVSFIIGLILILGYVVLFLGKYIKFLAFIEDKLLDIVFFIAKIIGNLKLSKIYIVSPNIIIVILYYILFIIYICVKDNMAYIGKKLIKLLKKYIIFLIITVFLLILVNFLKGKELQINMIDVSQGDCVLMKTPMKKTILIDGGDKSKDYDYGEKVVLPYLLKNGVQSIDYIIVSHFDSDHVGGLFTVMEKLRVKQVVICYQGKDSENYEEFKRIVNEKKIKVIIVKKRRRIKY